MINWDRISELQDEVGEDGIAEVIEIFVEEMEEGLASLASSSNPTEIADKLHFLKGSAQNIGLEEMSRLCAAGEHALRIDAAHQPDVDAIRTSLQHAQSELKALTI